MEKPQRDRVTIYRRMVVGVPRYFVRDATGELIEVPPAFVREHLADGTCEIVNG